MNNIDNSTLAVAGTSIGLDSASPTLATALSAGAQGAIIYVQTAPVYYREDGDDATSADPILYPGDALQYLGGHNRQILSRLKFLRTSSTSAALKIVWSDSESANGPRLIRGSAIAVTTDGVELAKSEDTAHTSGDKGIMSLGVRKDVPTALAGTDGDYVPPQFDQVGNLRTVGDIPMFGQPTLNARGNGIAEWQRSVNTPTLDLNLRDSSGWVARLFGGVQSSWDDGAEILFPVNEMHVPDFNSAVWTYHMKNAEVFGCHIDIWVHDPADTNKRAEIIQSGSTTGLGKAAGWNSHVLNTSTTQFFYYEDNGSGYGLTEGPANLYSWAQFQADVVFSTWTIYKITLNMGWYSTGCFEDVHLANVSFNGQNILLKPSLEEQIDMVRDTQVKALTTVPTWKFGEPTLQAYGAGSANWSRCEGQAALLEKSSTGWTACLYGGLQSGSYYDFARLMIPVNELPLPQLTSALWSWYQLAAQSMGVVLTIGVHDPTDFDKRAEITQVGSVLEKGAGWNAHELVLSTDQFYYYGENWTGTALTEGVPNYYGLDDFQADAIFSTWTIYRITFEWGWEASTTYQEAWVADVKINGTMIPMKPDSGGSGRIAWRNFTIASAADLTGTIAPKTPYRLLSMSVHVSATPDTGEVLTLTKDSGIGTDGVNDTVIFSDDLFIGTRTSLFVPFGEGYDFPAADEIDLFQTNGSGDTWGVTIIYQTVFP